VRNKFADFQHTQSNSHRLQVTTQLRRGPFAFPFLLTSFFFPILL
jgi:hypothetical protein